MKDSCDAPYHDFIVVNWLITPTSRQARELLCNNCLMTVDLSKVRNARCKHDEEEKEAHARRSMTDAGVILPEVPALTD